MAINKEKLKGNCGMEAEHWVFKEKLHPLMVPKQKWEKNNIGNRDTLLQKCEDTML